MKILICGRYLNAPIGGAEISARILIRYLLSRGHKLGVFTISNNNFKKIDWPFSKDISVFEGIFPKRLHKKLLPGELMSYFIEKQTCKLLDEVCNKFFPDLIISQSNLLRPNYYNKAKTVFFVRDYGFGTTLACSSLFRTLINKPFLNLRRSKLRNFDLVITVSLFMQSVLKKFSIESEVVYPFIDFSQYLNTKELGPSERNYITFIRPTRQKGVEIILKIVRKLTKRQFLIIGQLPSDLKGKIKSFNNISYIPWQSDMREVYSKTRLLLVPSIWNDPCPRVTIESALNGIPSIVSKRGGLPEAVGDGGILIEDIWNIDKWLEAIKAMDDIHVYEQYALKAKSNAKKFELQANFSNFTKILQGKLGIIL